MKIRLSLSKRRVAFALCAALLFVSVLPVTAQKTDKILSLDNVTVEQALSAIEHNSDYVFLVNDQTINKDRIVSLSGETRDISVMLDQIFRGTSVKWEVTGKQIILSSGKTSRNQKSSAVQDSVVNVSGVVIDASGNPVIGAGVVQRGTTNGTVTDVDGKYTISVPKGASIEISCIGYATQYIKEGAVPESIVLQEDSQMLEETVVVGYGVQKKRDLTGSISQIKSGDMADRTISNAGQALQGKTSGVQVYNSSARPGASPTVRIRGIASNGSSDPLFVVDGRIAESINEIDPNDIESMEVLKDGASAAIYGARAGNGVILITTKKGGGDGRITYSYQLTAQSLSNVPDVMNAEEYRQYYIDKGTFSADYIDSRWDGETDTDWVDYAYETSIMQHHTVTLDAGNDKGSLYVSASYLDNNGIYTGDDDVFERITGMINGSWKIKPWLNIITNNQISHSRVRSVSEGGYYTSAVAAALGLDPLTPTTYTEADLPEFMKAFRDAGYNLLKDEDGNYYSISQFNYSDNVNPLIQRDRSKTTVNAFSLNGSTSLIFTPIKDLSITERVGYKMYNSDTYGYTRNYYANSNVQQRYVGLNGESGDNVYYQLDEFANYAHDFGKHSISAMVGMSYSQKREFDITGSYQGSDTDMGVIVNDPLFYYFAYATSTASKTLEGAEPIYTRNLSYFCRLSWNYAGKYYLQGSFRADAADLSILPKDKRWGYFPAVSGGWTISREPFYSGIKNYVPYLKFRASWGQNGSTASLSDYLYANAIASTSSIDLPDGTTINAYSPTATGNNNLKWETSEQFNVGLDARFLNDRLTFSMDWYKKKTKDLIVSDIIPSTLIGVKASPMNAGDIENKGWEFELSWHDTIGKDFYYSVSANLSTLKNKVTYLHPALSDGIDGDHIRGYGYITRFEKGYPAWHFIGYKYTGVDPETGNATFEDINKDGMITVADKTDLGSGIPDVSYGVTINMSWKNLDLLVFGSGQAGNQIYTNFLDEEYAENRMTVFTKNRWTPTHKTGAENPAASASNWTQYAVSSAVVFSGNYFKIKQIQLGYTLPSNWSKAIRISSLRVYGSLDDFFTITDYPGFDPEITGVGSSLGVDRGNFPTSRKVVFGVNVSF